jgi:hypothetical protein
MCMQCMATAATTVGAASGIRAWLAYKRPAWITDRRLRIVTVALLTLAVLAAAVRF